VSLEVFSRTINREKRRERSKTFWSLRDRLDLVGTVRHVIVVRAPIVAVDRRRGIVAVDRGTSKKISAPLTPLLPVYLLGADLDVVRGTGADLDVVREARADLDALGAVDAVRGTGAAHDTVHDGVNRAPLGA
jgi:hypothetical protein